MKLISYSSKQRIQASFPNLQMQKRLWRCWSL